MLVSPRKPHTTKLESRSGKTNAFCTSSASLQRTWTAPNSNSRAGPITSSSSARLQGRSRNVPPQLARSFHPYARGEPSNTSPRLKSPALPATSKGQTGNILRCPQRDYHTTSVAHFCTGVLSRSGGFSFECTAHRYVKRHFSLYFISFVYIKNDENKYFSITWRR